jgi:alpha-tubulin suppressor-like RCC1 family protein
MRSFLVMVAVVIGARDARAKPSPADVVALAVGVRHSCALHSDGAVSCWGANDRGELGDGTLVRSAVPVRVDHLDDAVEIATDGIRTCARRRDGTVSCWGPNTGANPGTKPTPIKVRGVVQLSGTCLRTTQEVACLNWRARR